MGKIKTLLKTLRLLSEG